MTTPAQNYSVNTNTSYNVYNGATKVWSYGGVFVSGIDRRVRPASGTSLFNQGWRPCRGWTHSGLNSSFTGSVNYRVQKSNMQIQTGYSAGAMWGVFSPLTNAPFVPNSMKSEAEVKALNKLKNQDIHVGVAIAEGKRTINMVANNILTIVRQVRKFKRDYPNLWKKVKRYQNGQCPRSKWWLIPSKWLEIQYGWRPLLSDILGGMDALEKSFEEDNLFRVGSKVTKPWVVDRVHNGRLDFKWSTHIEGSMDYHVALWYKLTLPELAEVSSLGLINPLEIVWEMVPFSFVVDWLLPIGPWMGSLTGDLGYTFKGGSGSAITRGKERVHRFDTSTATGLLRGPGPTVHCQYFNFVRTCYVSSPVPGFYVKNPFSSVTRVLNAIALLATTIRGK